MSETLDCPSCHRPLRVPDDLVGRAVRCPSCNHTFTAPDAGEERSELDEPAPVVQAAPPALSGYADEFAYPRPRPKPGKVLAVAIMTLAGGIVATLIGTAYAASCFLLVWPGTYYSLVSGILNIVKGSQLLGERAYEQPPPQANAILQIVNIINGDVVNLVLGIITLVFLNEPEVKPYFRARPA